MSNHHRVHGWEHDCAPSLFSIHVLQSQLKNLKLGLSKSLMQIANTCSLDIRYVFFLPWFIGWSPLAPGRASPLVFTFFLDVKKQPIHKEAPSTRATALDQDACDFIFRCRNKFSPMGDAGRILSAILVERSSEHSDGACEARCNDSGESPQLLFARANKSSLGLPCFCSGKKHRQIFALLTQCKNRTALKFSRKNLTACAAGAVHSALFIRIFICYAPLNALCYVELQHD